MGAALLIAVPAAGQGGAHGDALGNGMASGGAAPHVRSATDALRVCADPNNMPFSDRAGEGFENRIAVVLARDLGVPVKYTWWAQRRGFVRSTLGAGLCDVVIGITAGDEQVTTTHPYYRSTYVFVTRRASRYHIDSFDDPRLSRMRIGIHVIGADYNSLPPGVALARRGLVHNVVGFSIYGNYAEPSPPSILVNAVARGTVDIAAVWGPLAGYYASRSSVPLTITPVRAAMAMPGIPFAYDIAAGVRHGDTLLLRRLNTVLARRQQTIQQILRRYGVPVIAFSPSMPATAARANKACSATAEERRCA